jgi:hypothetical protein
MATELYGRANTTVVSLVRGLNQAAVLTAQDERRVDDAGILAAGTEVQYTDPDLGLVFFGRIVSVEKAYNGGEGARYNCADAYRTLAKQPALISNSSRILIQEGKAVSSVLTPILNGLPSGTLPGGYDVSIFGATTAVKQDKAGQTVDTWLDSMMKLTGDIVAWIEPNGGSPKLWFKAYESQPDLTLEVGSYNVINPTSGGNPLLVGAELGQSLDRKYRGVRIEGCGHWQRFNDKFLPATLIGGDEPSATYEYKFWIPEEHATGRYLQDEKTCYELTDARFVIGISGGDPITMQVAGMPISRDETTGQYFFHLQIVHTGLFWVYPPPVPIVAGYFTYTAWVGPSAIELVSSDPQLAGEGLFVMQRNDMVKFTSVAYSKDDTAKMTALAYELYDRHSGTADSMGSAVVHIKGLNANVVLGARLTNAQFNSARVRSIRYDFVERNMDFECSDLPVREAVENAKRRSQLSTEDGDNWWKKHERAESCMCLDAMYVDETGDGEQGGDAGFRGPTYDCVQGMCIIRNDDRGQYVTQNDCARFCVPKSWHFVPCAGCVPSEDQGFGQYQSLSACLAAHPEGAYAPEFNCGGHSSGSIGTPRHGSGMDWNCPSGVKRITVDRNGAINNVECL